LPLRPLSRTARRAQVRTPRRTGVREEGVRGIVVPHRLSRSQDKLPTTTAFRGGSLRAQRASAASSAPPVAGAESRAGEAQPPPAIMRARAATNLLTFLMPQFSLSRLPVARSVSNEAKLISLANFERSGIRALGDLSTAARGPRTSGEIAAASPSPRRAHSPPRPGRLTRLGRTAPAPAGVPSGPRPPGLSDGYGQNEHG
jgi:hypothetical protein